MNAKGQNLKFLNKPTPVAPLRPHGTHTALAGLYVYCIRPFGSEMKEIGAKGVTFGGEVYGVPFRDIEAVVSEVDILQYNEKEITKRLQYDVGWTKKNVEHHHKIVARVGERSAVIPMKFCTLFKTKKHLEEMLKTHYREFVDLLTLLKEREEWGIKVYLEQERFIENIKKEDKEIQEWEERRFSLPNALTWYFDKKIDELIRKRLDEEVETYLEGFLQALKSYSENIVVNNPQPAEFEGKKTEMVLNGACLIKKEKLTYFKEQTGKIFEELGKRGFELEITGPWPPYNFVKINERYAATSKVR